ncbi:MAG: hypothetical protein LQ340_007048 [Diploschistes diacapsis]|nr:MAG: hypothetical protein LQ340_007048 [Diploschistes diacapsis]
MLIKVPSPVFELKEILSGKYGEDSKLIYDLQDQGGELCSLRYDLTQQCDIDFAGTHDAMVPDAEILRIAVEVFEGLGWKGRYSIKVNHRQILDGMFAVCGVPQDKIRTISSAVDKLDKSPWEEVKKEMVDEKGLPKEVADKIWSFVQKKGGRDVLQYLQSEESLKSNESMTKGLADMELLFTYLDAFGITDKVEFNLSLARGLDYYTGVIYEVVTEGSAPPASSADPTAIAPPKPSGKKSKSKAKEEDEDRSDDPTIGVGSVAAGGRYDGLVGMFSGKNQIPCVGISFGVDRIFSVTKARMEADKAVQAVRSTEVDVYVMAFGFGKTFSGFLTERMEVCRTLWEAGIKAEFSYKLKPKLPAQFKLAEAGGVPFAVILGEEEQAQGKVKIKEMGLPDGHPEKDGVPVDLKDLVSEVRARLRRKAEEEGGGMEEGREVAGDGAADTKREGAGAQGVVDRTKEGSAGGR